MMDMIDEEAWHLADKRQRIFKRELDRYSSLGFWGKVFWRMNYDLETFERVANGSRLNNARFIVADPLHRRLMRGAANPPTA